MQRRNQLRPARGLTVVRVPDTHLHASGALLLRPQPLPRVLAQPDERAFQQIPVVAVLGQYDFFLRCRDGARRVHRGVVDTLRALVKHEAEVAEGEHQVLPLHGGQFANDPNVELAQLLLRFRPHSGQQRRRQRRQESGLVPRRDILQSDRFGHHGSNPADHLVGSDPERSVEVQLLPDLLLRAPGRIPWRTENASCARHVEIGLAVARGLQHWRKAFQDPAESARRPRVERLVRRQHHQVAAAAQCARQDHPFADARLLRFRRQGRHNRS